MLGNQSVFKKYYPRLQGSKVYSFNQTMVESRVIHYTDTDYLYWIDSPSTSQGERTYPLIALEELLRNEDVNDQESRLRGDIGETICRIHTDEFLRRNKNELGITQFEFCKRNGQNPSLSSDSYKGVHRNRYAIEIFEQENVREPVTEYDGVVFYQTTQNKEGVLICEAKTGDIDYFGSIESSQKARTKLQNRIIRPTQSLFEGKTIDVLLMVTPRQLYQNREKNQIHEKYWYLFEALQKEGIGLLVRPFRESRKEFTKLVEKVKLQKRLSETHKDLKRNGDKTWQELNGFVYLFKGKRLDALYKKTRNGLEQIRVREQFLQ